ncbi:MAG: hypothetical protein GX571_09220 [Lentisphaerae bacterium]|jgi:pyruvate/2-oxoglutarate dehydrogenase complex dihydrolipoamide dehydrogenase (E3) component|nr:hypothetical protein [Lentisphaerota bacterium]
MSAGLPPPDAPFDTVYDLIVCGAGYAGFGAIRQALLRSGASTASARRRRAN